MEKHLLQIFVSLDMKILALVSISLILLSACDKNRVEPNRVPDEFYCFFRTNDRELVMEAPAFTQGTYSSGGMKAFYFQAKTGDEKFQVNANDTLSVRWYTIAPGTPSKITVSYTNDSGYTYILREGIVAIGEADNVKNVYRSSFRGVFKNQFQQNDSFVVTDGGFYYK